MPTAPTTDCTADFNGDGEVGGSDLARMLSEWASNDPVTDLDADGVVGGADLAALLSQWGSCTP